MIATFYVAIVVPYSAAFRESNTDTPVTIYSDVFVEIIFIIGESKIRNLSDQFYLLLTNVSDEQTF